MQTLTAPEPEVAIDLEQLHDFGDDPGVPEGDPGAFDPSDPASYPDTRKMSASMSGLLETQIGKYDEDRRTALAASQAKGIDQDSQMGAGVDFGDTSLEKSPVPSAKYDMDLGQAADEYEVEYVTDANGHVVPVSRSSDSTTSIEGPFDMRTHAMSGERVASAESARVDLKPEGDDNEDEPSPSHTAVNFNAPDTVQDSEDEDLPEPIVMVATPHDEGPGTPPDSPPDSPAASVAMAVLDADEMEALAALDADAEEPSTPQAVAVAVLDADEAAEVAVAAVVDEDEPVPDEPVPEKWNI